MQIPKFLIAAFALEFEVAAVPTNLEATEGDVVLSRHTARSYQAASSLHNVSTFHVLTRIEGSISQAYRRAHLRGVWTELDNLFQQGLHYQPIF